jgi:exonuclease III
MAFRKKAKAILDYDPDILIVPECESPAKLKFPSDVRSPADVLWYGSNPNKGLGIFSYSKFRFRQLDEYNPDFRFVIPLKVTDSKRSFDLYAIWANNPDDREGRYITQVWKAVNYYSDLLKNNQSVLAGDFNSNTIWDRPRRKGNHSTVVQALAAKNIHSAYHYHLKQEQGKEQHPTLFMYRKQLNPYHIDYCFAPTSYLSKLKSVEIGDYSKWCHMSDHVPLIATFDI